MLKLPKLEILDLSGDSWISKKLLKVVGKLPNLRVFRMGHYEHSDCDCNSINDHYSAMAYVILEDLVEPGAFPMLQ